MLKLIILGIVAYVVYKMFFTNKNKDLYSNKKDSNDEDELVECIKCGVFVSKKEAILTKDGYICKECYDNLK